MGNAGKYKKKITFQRIVQKSDSLGDHPVPEDVKTVRASVKGVRGREYYEAQKIRPEKTFIIKCRYFLLDGEEISNEMTIMYKGRQLKIADVINIDEDDREYEIHATESTEKKVADYVE